MTSRKYYLVGGGIAALSAAVILIRDHGIDGSDIEIFETGPVAGGSLDGGQSVDGAFVVRGARMMEDQYLCTRDIMASIPSFDLEGQSLDADFQDFNAKHPVPHGCIPVSAGGLIHRPVWHLPRRHLRTLLRTLLRSETRLDGLRICDVFERDFFDTDMWLAFSTTFAFQPWHSVAELRRYMRRFLHHGQKLEKTSNLLTTRYNQRESLIAPIEHWLSERGVSLRTGRCVTDASFEPLPDGGNRVSSLLVDGEDIPVTAQDRVCFTLGSITDGARVSAPGAPPPASGPTPAFDLWQRLAAAAPGFGRPEAFIDEEARTGWQSFTITLPKGGLLDYLSAQHPEGVGATVLYALAGSPWRAALVPFIQPHFRNQPQGSEVVWGYGLRPDRPGARCGVPMDQATGTEIMDEIADHFSMTPETRARLFEDAVVVSCRMPLITSQFMPRRPGDRPEVRPAGAANYALMGQFVEIPFDTVFTVEYSVRSGWEAVNSLLPGGRPPPPVTRPDRDPKILMNVISHRLRTMI